MFKRFAFLMTFFFLMSGIAYAGTVDLPESGQTISSATGNDREINAGVKIFSPRSVQSARASEIPERLLPVLIQAMEEEISESYYAKPLGNMHFTAENSAQQLNIGFSTKGIEVSGGDKNHWRMYLDAYGFDGKLLSTKPVVPKAEGARIKYGHDGLTEWYINSPYGLEQGFTVQAPAKPKAIQLTLSFSLEGDGEIKQHDDTLLFTSDGKSLIRYGGLHTSDATGRILASNLALQGKRLHIEVDVTDAIYPVTVDPLFSQETKLYASDGGVHNQFGQSVAISGNTAVIETPGDIVYGTDSGSAYVFVRSGATWTEQQKLIASDGATNFGFGSSIAINGDTAIIGSPQSPPPYSGSVYVFVRSGTTWTEQQQLFPSDGSAYDKFGSSVSVSGDTAVIGAWGDDDNGSSSGSAYVFVWNGATWSEQQKLTPSDGAANDQFGSSVAISGGTAIIGTPKDDDNGSASGSAYIFVRSGATWNEQQKLLASDGATVDRFGDSVAISGDTAVIGAFFGNNQIPGRPMSLCGAVPPGVSNKSSPLQTV